MLFDDDNLDAETSELQIPLQVLLGCKYQINLEEDSAKIWVSLSLSESNGIQTQNHNQLGLMVEYLFTN